MGSSFVICQLVVLAILVLAVRNCQALVLQGTNADAEYLSAATKDAHERNSKTNKGQQLSSIVTVGESRQASSASANSSTSSIASQDPTAGEGRAAYLTVLQRSHEWRASALRVPKNLVTYL
ncbi:uncharacterized protein LOC111267882 isoform X2 [Varroa jacobsoni]|uniref:Uncharacterized protein n=1 Tax=Varroa destructor TaxID=109461 RepID=A0A7M7K7X9_VARDE|nr:uncharacterized protein LOC111250573 isoform X2 [Varroa destructor]XP_022702189.1 uncharacterized protein LOC111267882 isoform X2 [Varroa jacobsoni]